MTTFILAVATALAFTSLFVVGAVKASVAKTSKIRSGLENLVIAGVGGVIAWAIGNAVGATIT